MSCDESCPGCGEIDRVEQTSVTPRVTAWKCTRCGMSWAISRVNHGQRPAYFEQLAAAVEEVERLRWTLAQVIAVADDAVRAQADVAPESRAARTLVYQAVCRPAIRRR